MEFKIDENLPSDACLILRDAGHDAVSVLDQQLGGHPNSDVANICQAESRTLVTLDTDFANIIAYPPEDYSGIIVIRTEDQSKPVVLAHVRQLADILRSESPRRRLWILEADRVRVRGAE